MNPGPPPSLFVCFQRGLCCFPGFPNPGSASRKGKISQPLLASVTSSSLPLFEPSGFLQGLVTGAGSSSNRPDDMLLLEKQGLCSQQQRQPESSSRCVSLPPSSLPRPKRQKPPSSKLGEYGRLSDSESGSRKLSTDSEKIRDSPTNLPRKLGEYGRLSDSQERKTPTPTPSNDSKQSRESSLPMPKYVSLGERRKLSPSPARDVGKFPQYGRYSEERKVSGSPTLYCPQARNMLMYEQQQQQHEERAGSKSRENSFKSLLPPPRKVDYGCFMQEKSSGESKLRIFSPNAGLRSRRGSLQRESPSPKLGQSEANVRSLPSPNKYRIQFWSPPPPLTLLSHQLPDICAFPLVVHLQCFLRFPHKKYPRFPRCHMFSPNLKREVWTLLDSKSESLVFKFNYGLVQNVIITVADYWFIEPFHPMITQCFQTVYSLCRRTLVSLFLASLVYNVSCALFLYNFL